MQNNDGQMRVAFMHRGRNYGKTVEMLKRLIEKAQINEQSKIVIVVCSREYEKALEKCKEQRDEYLREVICEFGGGKTSFFTEQSKNNKEIEDILDGK